MAVATPAIELPVRRERTAAKILRTVAKAPLRIVLATIGLLWLVPTFGLFITSILPQSALASKGWWQIFSKPSLATWSNYDALFHNSGLDRRGQDDRLHRGRQHGARRPARLDGRLRPRLARVPRPRLALHRDHRPARRAAPDGADPDVQGLRHRRDLRTRCSSIILFHTAFGLPFAIFLLRNFFVGIPKDILESARIDGASELRIFFRLMLPLGLPAIASLAIFQFLWTWNDLIVSLTFGVQPITVWIFGQLREFGTSIGVIAPASFISLVIPLCVFFAFQRYFVQGLLAGSVK